MEAAIKRDQLVTPRGVARELDRAFDRFRAGIAEEHFLVGCDFGMVATKAFGELRHVPVVKISAGDVDQFGGLFLNGSDNFGMAVAGRTDGNAGGKIQESVAVGIFDDGAVGMIGDERIIPHIRRRHELVIIINHQLAISSPAEAYECGEVWFLLRWQWS